MAQQSEGCAEESCAQVDAHLQKEGHGGKQKGIQ